jgi:RNA polymerase sigma factor for flagellar operon FliA
MPNAGVLTVAPLVRWVAQSAPPPITLRTRMRDVLLHHARGVLTLTAVPIATTDDRTDVLWTRYRSAGDPDARAQLLTRHLGLVHHVAREVSRRIPSVELGELVSAGALGLMKALDSFDLSRGLAFSTYAVLRIRGAILDDLRSRDSTPRSVRVKRRRIESVAAALEAGLGRAPSPQEVADRLGIDLATYWKWKDAVGSYAEADTPRPIQGRRASRDAENHADPSATSAPQRLVESEHIVQLQQLISRLPEQQRRVLALYYYEELNLRQVGEILQVSESRVSQIRSQALRRLKAEITTSSLAS